MRVDPIDIAVLSSPVPLPGEVGTLSPGSFKANTQENFTAMTQGSGVASPIGTGNVTTPLPTSDPTLPRSSGDILGEALESGGANVGGLVKTTQEDEPMDLEYVTADEEADAMEAEEYEGLVEDYEDAYEESGMRGARDVKKEDREADKIERQAAFRQEKEAAKQLKGKEKRQAKKAARSKKRASRQDERRQRRSAFKEFKANR